MSGLPAGPRQCNTFENFDFDSRIEPMDDRRRAARLEPEVRFLFEHRRILRFLVLRGGYELLDLGLRVVGDNRTFFHPTLNVGTVADAVPVILPLEHFDFLARIENAQCARSGTILQTQRRVLCDDSRLIQDWLRFGRATRENNCEEESYKNFHGDLSL